MPVLRRKMQFQKISGDVGIRRNDRNAASCGVGVVVFFFLLRFLLVRCLNVSCRLHRQTARLISGRPAQFQAREAGGPIRDFHSGDTHPLLLTAASGDMALIARTSGLISSCASS